MTPHPASGVDDPGLVARLGFAAEQIVQEFGYDDDCAEALREQVEARGGDPLEGEDYTGEVGALLLWWRGDGGDLAGALAGLHAAGSFKVDAGWRAVKLVAPKAGARR